MADTINLQLSRIETAKGNIKTSIENKGVTVPDNALLSTYNTYIDQIQTGITPSGNIALTKATATDVTNYATATVSQCDASFYYNAQDMDEGRDEDLNINPGGTYNITNSEFTTILGNNGGNACGIETSYNYYYLDFSSITQLNASSWSSYKALLAMGTNVLEVTSAIGTSSTAGAAAYINVPIGWNSKIVNIKVNPITVNKYYTGTTTPAASLGGNGDIYLKKA